MDQTTIAKWLAQLADKQPTPGGGGVAALQAAISAALVGMVTIYTTGPKWVAVEKSMQQLNAEAAQLRQSALELMAADAEAFAQVGAAYALPKTTPEEKADRQRAIQAALKASAQPPCKVAELAERLVTISQQLVESGNPNVISDVAVAASSAKAALEAAIVNVEINRAAITDQQITQSLSDVISQARVNIEQATKVIAAVSVKITGDKS